MCTPSSKQYTTTYTGKVLKSFSMILVTGATLGVVAGLLVYYQKTNRREQLCYEETTNGSSELVTGC